MRFQTALATVVLVLGVAAVVRATEEPAAEQAEVAVDAQPQPTVMLELSSLSAVYAAADRPRPVTGSKNLNMAKYVDTSIKSSNQEEWGCCRVCDELNDLVQKIPPELEPEYGHSVRDRRRHVAPERGFQEFMPPMVSCCPTCLWPPKLDPAAARVPTLQGDMETEMSTYGRGDGPKDAAVVGGAAANDRVKAFAKFDAPNYRAPTADMVSGYKERELKRLAARKAAQSLLHARKYLNADAIAEAEAAVEANPMFLEIAAELDAQMQAEMQAEAQAEGEYADAEADAEDAAAEAEAEAESDESDESDADLRMAQVHAGADAEAGAEAEADAEKFKLGKALKKAGKFAKKILKKGLKAGLKAGKKLLKKVSGGIKRGLKKGLRGAADAAGAAMNAAADAAQQTVSGQQQQPQSQSQQHDEQQHDESDRSEHHDRERERDGDHESGSGSGSGSGADSGAPPPPGGASLLPPSGLSPEERMEWVNRRAERMEQEARAREEEHDLALRSGVPNVRASANRMKPFAEPVKPWNPLKDYRGDPMYYSTVTQPDVEYDDLGAGPVKAEELLSRTKPTPYLPPCCNMCGVNNGPRLTQPERYSTCCYYCVRKPYGARPPRMRLRESSRPEPNRKVTQETLNADALKAAARPQDDHADIFSPQPPMVHANRHRFG